MNDSNKLNTLYLKYHKELKKIIRNINIYSSIEFYYKRIPIINLGKASELSNLSYDRIPMIEFQYKIYFTIKLIMSSVSSFFVFLYYIFVNQPHIIFSLDFFWNDNLRKHYMFLSSISFLRLLPEQCLFSIGLQWKMFVFLLRFYFATSCCERMKDENIVFI